MSVFKRCGCTEVVDGKRRQLGQQCAKLAATGHGTWYYAVHAPLGIEPADFPRLFQRQGRQLSRGGWTSREQAEQAERRVREEVDVLLRERLVPADTHLPRRKRAMARRAGDLVSSGDCTPSCLLAMEIVCICRCDGLYHAALSEAPVLEAVRNASLTDA
jgi:hypothetical protein